MHAASVGQREELSRARIVDGQLVSASGRSARRIHFIDRDTGLVPKSFGPRPPRSHVQVVAAGVGEDPGGWPLDVDRLVEAPDRWMTKFDLWGWRPAIMAWLDDAGLEWLQGASLHKGRH